MNESIYIVVFRLGNHVSVLTNDTGDLQYFFSEESAYSYLTGHLLQGYAQVLEVRCDY